MVKTRTYYVVHDSAGAVIAVGFCDARVVGARRAALPSGLSMLEIDDSAWESVRADPKKFRVANQTLVDSSGTNVLEQAPATASIPTHGQQVEAPAAPSIRADRPSPGIGGSAVSGAAAEKIG